jgi:hypothetical protein
MVTLLGEFCQDKESGSYPMEADKKGKGLW